MQHMLFEFIYSLVVYVDGRKSRRNSAFMNGLVLSYGRCLMRPSLVVYISISPRVYRADLSNQKIVNATFCGEDLRAKRKDSFICLLIWKHFFPGRRTGISRGFSIEICRFVQYALWRCSKPSGRSAAQRLV